MHVAIQRFPPKFLTLFQECLEMRPECPGAWVYTPEAVPVSGTLILSFLGGCVPTLWAI